MTVTLPLEDVEKAERAADLLVPVWSALLAARSDIRESPVSILWKIEELVRQYPGAGLTFYECEGRCGLLVWDAPEDDRLTLCDSCRDDASHATEQYLLALVRHREAEDEDHPTRPPTRLADVLSEKLKARIALDDSLPPEVVELHDGLSGEVVARIELGSDWQDVGYHAKVELDGTVTAAPPRPEPRPNSQIAGVRWDGGIN